MRRLKTADSVRSATLSPSVLREHFLIDRLFQAGRCELVTTDIDRAIIGGVVPEAQALTLPNGAAMRTAYFAERREIGLLNIGGPGAIEVDGRRFPMAGRDALYIGCGSRDVCFLSDDPARPARYFLASYPAHAAHPTRHARMADATPVRLGAREMANERTIYKYIHEEGIRSCQLVMGFTQLQPGSVWNTMWPHTHDRRSEIYLYFHLPPSACVMHFMGERGATRHIVVRNEEAVISPPWSIHCGAGTQAYGFVWCMGGENQTFDDMDLVSVDELR